MAMLAPSKSPVERALALLERRRTSHVILNDGALPTEARHETRATGALPNYRRPLPAHHGTFHSKP
jgi:hypothetical protein